MVELEGSWCFLIIQKVKKEVSQVLSERWDPFRAVFGKNLTMTLTNSILLQIDRLQLTAVYCNRRVCKVNTSNDPFSRCKKSVQQFGYR